MALPFNFNVNNLPNADFFLFIFKGIFSLMKCEWIATKKNCKQFYSYERKGKLNFISVALGLMAFQNQP